METLDQDVLTYLEDELNTMIEKALDKYDNQPIAAELAMAAATLAAQFAKAGGTDKKGFLYLMSTIFDQLDVDISKMN